MDSLKKPFATLSQGYFAADAGFPVVKHYKWWILGSGVVGYLCYKLMRRGRRLPPGPWGLPIVGSMLQVSEDTIHLDLLRLGNKYGEIFSISTGRQLTIILNSPRVIREAFLQRGSDFADRPAESDDPYNIPYDEKFIVHKKIGVSALRSLGFGSFESEQKIVGYIDQLVQVLYSQKGNPANINKPVSQMCACIINDIVFGEHCKLDDPQLQRMITVTSNWVNLFFADGVFMFFFANMLPSWLGKIVYRQRFKKVDTYTHDMIKYMKEKVRNFQKNCDADNPTNLAEVYLNAQKKEKSKFSFDYLVGTIMMFIPDAIDSMAHQICWMILILSQRPELQKELQDELQEVCGNRPITLADRGALIKMTAFLLETYRFSSLTVTSLPHCALRDGLALEGYDIPRGANIFANVYSMHYNPKFFPNPDIFTLDHFLNEKGEIVNADKSNPFSFGRRNCMGEQLAKVEMFLVATTLLQKFNFSFPPGDAANDFDFKVIGGHFRRAPIFSPKAVPRF